MQPLFPFQADAVERIVGNPSFLLFLDTGLGKTRVCIEAVKQLAVTRVLVICPAFLRLNWRDEIKKWDGDSLNHANITWDVVSYHYCTDRRVKRLVEGVYDGPYDMLICDEAHRLKDWGTQWTKNICLHLSKIPRKIFCTATPIVKHAGDLHPMLSCAQPGQWGKYGEFCEKVCNRVTDPWSSRGYRYEGVSKVGEAKLKGVLAPIMLRKFKHEVEADLPEKIESTVRVEVDDVLPAELSIDEQGDVVQDEHFVKERHNLGLAKIGRVVEWIDEVVGEAPVVVFAHHRDVVGILTEKLGEGGIPTASILGGMSDVDRHRIVVDFQAGKIKRLVGSIGAMGAGLTLTAASIAVFAEMPISYVEYKQCSDRVHRIGSKRCVNIYKILAYNSLDERLEQIVEYKRVVADKTIKQM